MRRTWQSALLAIAAVLALLVAAPAAGQVLQYGGTLVVGMGVDTPRWDIHRATGMQGLGVQRLVTENLTDLHWETGELLPNLAESWEASRDATTWTIRLRRGVQFHDGTPFDAEAVKFNLERVLDVGVAKGSFDMIERIEVKDAHTVMLYTTPFAPLMRLFAYAPSGIASPTQIKKLGSDSYFRQPIGTGPYTFVEHARGERSVLMANGRYWGGRPYINRVIMRVVPDIGARVAALEAGDLDVAYDVPPTETRRLEANPGIRIVRGRTARTVYVGINTQYGPLREKRVRQALNYAVDKEAILKGIYLGEGRVSDAPFTNIAFGHAAMPVYRHDPARAKALLTEAGYPDGFEITLTYAPGRYSMDTQLVEAVAAYLRAVGVRVKIQAVEWATFGRMRTAPLEESKIQLYLLAFGNAPLDADHGLKPLRPDQFPPESDNPTFYDNPRFMPLHMQARSTTDTAKRQRLYKELIRMVWDDAPWIFLIVQPNIHAARKRAQGVYIRSDETIWLHKAWIAPGR